MADRRNSTALAKRPTAARFGILALIASGTLINYLDRSILSIVAPLLSKELAINAVMMGLIFSAFSWSYSGAQVLGGLFLDRFGTKVTYALSVSFWSLITFGHAFVNSTSVLFGMRLALGVAESPCFPANSRIVATWFPQNERALATAVYTVGEYIGLAFFSPLMYWLLDHFGWRSLFAVCGFIGLVFAGVWLAKYCEPFQSRKTNAAERDLIEAGGGTTGEPAGCPKIDWGTARQLLKFRQMWGICIGQFAGNSTLVFFLTWFPSYLVTERHMDFLKVGFDSILPFIAASLGVIVGGWWSDGMLRMGMSATLARKIPVITGLLLATTIVAANFVTDNTYVIAILSIAFFAQGMAALGWALVSDIAPSGMLGLTGGVFNLAANGAGVVTPLVIGAIVTTTGSFMWALFYVGALALTGAFAYIFVLGPVRRIEL